MYPVLVDLGGLKVFSYGVMLGLSCVMGAHLTVYLCERTGVAARRAWWFAILVIVSGVIGGRIHDLIVTGAPLEEWFELRHSGRTAYGGFLAATVGGVAASVVLKVPFWRFGDAVAPAMALGLGITRIGCFLYGCDFGVRSETLGVCFPGPTPSWPAGSPAWQAQVEAGLIPSTAEQALPVLPAQLLASAAGFAIFAGLWWSFVRRPKREGSVLLAFFLVYGLVRAGLEQLRDDPGRGELLGLSTSTTIGLITAAVAAAALFAPPLARLRPEAVPLEGGAQAAAPEGERASPRP